jgi:hypothetical protein
MTALSELKLRARADEAKLIRTAIEGTGGAWRATAAILGIQVSTLQRMLGRHPELAQLRTELRNRVNSNAESAQSVTRKRKSYSRVKHKTRVSA